MLEMKRRLGNNGERRKQLRKHDHNSQLHSRLEAKRQRRRRQWLIQQEKEREHEKLKQKMILEHKLKRGYEKGASHSKGKLANRSNSKSNNSIKYIKTRSSKSSAIPGKSDTLCGTTSLFKGPEGIQISEKELHCIKVDIHRNIPVKGQMSELQRDIINPEDVIIIRRSEKKNT
ncbi:complementary sex determiner [Vespula squamosa]|uniref:Complementary sex determiner n=1 Tax=Vespula squamosa TaxID=30214 RepID=A0ABD1ZV62_VESSQ